MTPSMMPSPDSVAAGAEGHVLTHESEECSRRKQRESKPVTQNWQCPWLWAALGGKPDTDFVEGTAIVSHPNGPELALAQVLQQR